MAAVVLVPIPSFAISEKMLGDYLNLRNATGYPIYVDFYDGISLHHIGLFDKGEVKRAGPYYFVWRFSHNTCGWPRAIGTCWMSDLPGGPNS
ncbi:MAG: hypothetical protein KGN02_08230 [bacterium]|nr:hypothetical protein [bacterium]